MEKYGEKYTFKLLACRVSNDCGMTAERLRDFYAKFGFETTCFSHESNTEIAYPMERQKNSFNFQDDDWIFEIPN
jgi:hypothetical protein